MKSIRIGDESFPIQEELTTSYSLSPKNGKAYLYIRHRIFYIKPQIKFVRGKDKEVAISKNELACYEITTPYKIVKEQRSRSWLGNGIQQDDINCYEEFEVDVIEYDTDALQNFIHDKLSLHSLTPQP